MDMLVKLYALPPLEPAVARAAAHGIAIRRALPPELPAVSAWVERAFGAGWAAECAVAFARQPCACFVAVRERALVGFACHDATCRNFFGPTGVDPELRGTGVGAALLLACLHAMAAQGYAYAIIGGVGPAEFYAKVAGATPIPGSEPGIYGALLEP